MRRAAEVVLGAWLGQQRPERVEVVVYNIPQQTLFMSYIFNLLMERFAPDKQYKHEKAAQDAGNELLNSIKFRIPATDTVDVDAGRYPGAVYFDGELEQTYVPYI